MASAENSKESSKLDDFYSDPQYERRIVLFSDVLGWKSEIANAASLPSKIGNLRRLILFYSRFLRLPTDAGIKVSTFSDNVVVSIKPRGNISLPAFLVEIAYLQLASAASGFLIRGGVTIGDIVHDLEAVFGPALNRAYELESKIAKYPRIIIEPRLFPKNAKNISGFTSIEDGVHFIDPFQIPFVQYQLNRQGTAWKTGDVGIPQENPELRGIPADLFLAKILEQLKTRIRGPLKDKEWEKVAWLFDRIAKRLGVPLSISYPRVHPKA